MEVICIITINLQMFKLTIDELDIDIKNSESDLEQSDPAKPVIGVESEYQQTPVKTLVKKKKRPGRPRKNPIREPKPRNGIVSQPTDASNFMEFLYDKPIIFKKLWQYFKLMAVDKIQIIFRKDEIIMWGEDHHKKSKMRVRIDATKINHYYCKDELDIGMNCRNPELVMTKIDKTYSSLLFLSKVGYVQKDLRAILKNDIEIDESHKIELIGEYQKIEGEHMFLDEDYPIKFELPGRYFKKMISDIRAFSDQITLRQDSYDESLIFEYTTQDKKINSENIVRNNKMIKFTSTIQEEDTFRTSFKIDYVKPISSALLSENITIYAHEQKPLMFIVRMDNDTIELRILTKIIDER
jgi:hypothetical protein